MVVKYKIIFLSDPPEVYIERPWVHAAEGKLVTLVCRVYSNPLARVCIMIVMVIIFTMIMIITMSSGSIMIMH